MTVHDAVPATDDGGRVLVYAAAVSWDDVPGTDRRIVDELSRSHHVLWVDPPSSVLREPRGTLPMSSARVVAPGVTRVHTVGPPAVSRPGVRAVARRFVDRHVRRVVRRHRFDVEAVIGLPATVAGIAARAAARIYYLTDDVVAGAGLMGTTTDAAARALAANMRLADAVVTVTATLGESLPTGYPDVRRVVVPNGCSTLPFAVVDRLPRPADVPEGHRLAGVVGQLNERLDLHTLEVLADRGVHLLLVGPRTERDPVVAARLDALIARPSVHWVGPKPYELLPAYLGAIGVGLTPYVDSDFNRASCPLKTLEYLAAGRPVVASDLPAVRALETEFVTIASGAEQFADEVQRLLNGTPAADAHDRRAFAAGHSWQARADAMLALVDQIRTDSDGAHGDGAHGVGPLEDAAGRGRAGAGRTGRTGTGRQPARLASRG